MNVCAAYSKHVGGVTMWNNTAYVVCVSCAWRCSPLSEVSLRSIEVGAHAEPGG